MMGRVSRSTLKTYFETGDRPTEAQFVDLIDSTHNTYANIKIFGAKGDGSSDDTSAIELALSNADHVVFPSSSNPYVLSTVTVPSNKTIILQEGADITVTDGNRGFQISNGSSNISIIGTGNNTITGVQDGGGYVSEHLINVTGSENIFISGLILKDTDGDGILIGGNSSDNACKNVMVDRCIIDNAGRNGISVTSVDFCIISRCEVRNVDSYLPKYGIDVEPNTGCECKRVIVDECYFHNNDVGGGFSSNVEDSSIVNSHFYNNAGNGLVMQGLDSGREQESCSVINCKSYDNGAIGIWAIRSHNGKISSCVSKNNGSYGVQLSTLDYFTVSDCDVQLNDDRGITISDINYVNISGNEVKNNADGGIVVTGSNTTLSIKDNFVSFNCTGASASFDSNIHIFALADGTIQNNTCREGSATNTPNNGIFFRSSTSNILFEGNDCLNGGSANGIIDNSTSNVNGGNRNNDGTYSQTEN